MFFTLAEFFFFFLKRIDMKDKHFLKYIIQELTTMCLFIDLQYKKSNPIRRKRSSHSESSAYSKLAKNNK